MLAHHPRRRAPRDIFYEAQEEEEVATKNEAEAEPLVPNEDTGATSRWNSFSLLRAIPMLAPLACLAASAVWETSAASVCALWLALELASRCLRWPLFGARLTSTASAERCERKGVFRRGGTGGGLFKIMLATTIFTAVALSGLVLVGGDEAAAVESGVGRALEVINVGQYVRGRSERLCEAQKESWFLGLLVCANALLLLQPFAIAKKQSADLHGPLPAHSFFTPASLA